MFETLESRRMMSVSTTTTQEPVIETTTSTVDASPSQLLSMLQGAFNTVIKSLGDALATAARRQ